MEQNGNIKPENPSQSAPIRTGFVPIHPDFARIRGIGPGNRAFATGLPAGSMSGIRPTLTVNQSEQIGPHICPQAVNTLDVPQTFAELQVSARHIAATVVKMAVSVIAAHFIPC